MEKWEYKTEITYANIDNEGARDYLKKKYPKFNPSKFSPETMQLRLDKLGEAGWELVHLQPISGAGDNMDVYFTSGGVYSNAYFCVFKRRKEA